MLETFFKAGIFRSSEEKHVWRKNDVYSLFKVKASLRLKSIFKSDLLNRAALTTDTHTQQTSENTISSQYAIQGQGEKSSCDAPTGRIYSPKTCLREMLL